MRRSFTVVLETDTPKSQLNELAKLLHERLDGALNVIEVVSVTSNTRGVAKPLPTSLPADPKLAESHRT
jgi:hypothetical protein